MNLKKKIVSFSIFSIFLTSFTYITYVNLDNTLENRQLSESKPYALLSGRSQKNIESKDKTTLTLIMEYFKK